MRQFHSILRFWLVYWIPDLLFGTAVVALLWASIVKLCQYLSM
jgi:hypothetical protein